MLRNRPFLKWAGGKYRLRQTILSHLPSGKRLIEPFVGSGAIFLNTDYEDYVLADQNADLIQLYQCLQKEGMEFIQFCRQFFAPRYNTAVQYQQLRMQFNETRDRHLKAALFLYLNRHSFNGLCRYNRAGIFNVPFGRHHRIFFPQREMQIFHQKSQQAVFLQTDFADTLKNSKKHDVVYCDPPYLPLSDTAYFTQYTHTTFDLTQQQLLARCAKKLAQKGIPVIISNHDTPLSREIYADATHHYFEVRRFISCDIENRKKAREILAIFHPAKRRQAP